MIRCPACKIDFFPKSKTSRFCSLHCAYQIINKEKVQTRKDAYAKNPLHCLECAKAITYRQKSCGNKYCSQRCAKLHTQSGRKRKPEEIKQSVILRTCEHCKIEFSKRKDYAKKFCSVACACTHRTTIRHALIDEKIERGEISDSKQLRRYLIERFGANCVECGQNSEFRGKYLCLQVDHIDGNSDNCLPGNLRLMCPNCHSQTPTYKGGNAKNSQRSKYRREWRKKILEKRDSVV